MSASPELARTPRPEFYLRPLAMVRSTSKIEENLKVVLPPKEETVDDSGGTCRTPTSEASKLRSFVATCPPAPRKPRRALQCKRKLWPELELIAVGAKEMEQLFKCRDGWSAAPEHEKKTKKRRCVDDDDDDDNI
ncbi:hypothetical protein Cni_G14131 [Canna indica]|uniref:Uncharacterized protein n=1 Tax=Canna indica TaxID=4628 RepID=A0AAQ3KAV0_9LILI|nr:hypothetical protein Cni_G14131 [Canna indica]